MEDISKIKQSINSITRRRSMLLNKTLRTKPFIAAQVYEHYKKCGRKGCKCQRGELHGPFLWIYQHKKGLPIISTTVDGAKRREAKDLAASYKTLLKDRKQLREMDQEIQELLNKLELTLEKEAKDYATKRSSGRPKKD